MEHNLENLITLQELELHFRERQCKIEMLEQEMTELRQRLDQAKVEAEETKAKFEENQKENRKLEVALKSKEEEKTKYQKQLFSVKTNREYQSLLNEIEKVKTESGKLEEKIIVRLEEADLLKGDLKRRKAQISKEKKRVEKECQKLCQQVGKHQTEQDTIKSKAGELKAKLEPEVLSDYERLLKLKRGLAVVLAQEEICSGCHMHIPPQLFEEIKRNDQIYRCPSCLRILFT